MATIFPARECLCQATTKQRRERVLVNSILRRKLEMEGKVYEPVGMKGWDEVVFVHESSQKRRSVRIDVLKNHFDVWGRNG